MKSIFQEISELRNWDYYERDNCEKIQDWNDENKHKEFIKTFFEISKKDNILNNFKIEIDDLSRNIHTNSVYFLGALFYEKLNLKELEKYERNDSSKQFRFIWFLSALVHDFYHDKERKLEEFTGIIEDIESVKLTNDLLSYTNKKSLCQDKIENLFKTIPNYFKYRFYDGKVDHGIMAGIKLFDLLETNRVQKKENKNTRYWKDDLTPLYAQAGLAIAMHNIWLSGTKEDIKEKYRKADLETLITGENTIFPISIKDNPLLFLLGLVDTIEPIKTFNCVTPQYVLENIMISFNKKQNQIIIKNKKHSRLDFEKLKRNTKGLEGWLDIKIIEEINKIIIKIKR
ncbi:hypothetical protein [Aliarcobacter butzleri]|uniref:hypothetical protein n=1 Tax=Aliarcobacter butzleri TaxID=28197 RepID=UPI003AF68404